MKICGNCEYNDGVVYTSFPPMMKCTITKEFHRNDHACELEFVPVVRCKDCKYFYKEADGYTMCDNSQGYDHVMEYDYCSRGERKNGCTQ